jgi:hypothetical protein
MTDPGRKKGPNPHLIVTDELGSGSWKPLKPGSTIIVSTFAGEDQQYASDAGVSMHGKRIPVWLGDHSAEAEVLQAVVLAGGSQLRITLKIVRA